MFDFTIFVILVCAYFVINRHGGLEVQAMWAIGLMLLYLLLNHAIPPHPPMQPRRLGMAFSFVPMISIAAVLFAQFSTDMPEDVVRVLGWIGLIAMMIILCVFKVFVW